MKPDHLFTVQTTDVIKTNPFIERLWRETLYRTQLLTSAGVVGKIAQKRWVGEFLEVYHVL